MVDRPVVALATNDRIKNLLLLVVFGVGIGVVASGVGSFGVGVVVAGGGGVCRQVTTC